MFGLAHYDLGGGRAGRRRLRAVETSRPKVSQLVLPGVSLINIHDNFPPAVRTPAPSPGRHRGLGYWGHLAALGDTQHRRRLPRGNQGTSEGGGGSGLKRLLGEISLRRRPHPQANDFILSANFWLSYIV